MWIITAWHHISPEMIVKSVKKCCISNTMDGTDDEGTGCEGGDSDTDW